MQIISYLIPGILLSLVDYFLFENNKKPLAIIKNLSRNTEGSGLGPAIAKGFVEAQGGNLKVDIIGDLFIVNIDFNLS